MPNQKDTSPKVAPKSSSFTKDGQKNDKAKPAAGKGVSQKETPKKR